MPCINGRDIATGRDSGCSQQRRRNSAFQCRVLASSAFSLGEILLPQLSRTHKVMSRPDMRCECVGTGTRPLRSISCANDTPKANHIGLQGKYYFVYLCRAHVCIKRAELGMAQLACFLDLAQIDGERCQG